MDQKKFDSLKTWEDYEKTLTLHDGCWAIDTPKGLYVFPPYTSKEEALKVLRQAYDYNFNHQN